MNTRMNNWTRRLRFLGAFATAICGAPLIAAGQTALFTFGYTDLDGTFDGSTTWTMRSTSMTAGDVTRGVAPFGTANFDPGFASTVADFRLDMSVRGIGSHSAVGLGTFTIVDADGDTITGQFTGNWQRLTSQHASYSGVLQNVSFSNGGTFDGTHGGSFDMNFSGAQPYNGAIVVLEAGGWFANGAFRDRNSLVQGSIIPAPGAAFPALMGLAIVGWAKKRAGRKA